MSYEFPSNTPPAESAPEQKPERLHLYQQEATLELFEEKYASDPEIAPHLPELKKALGEVFDDFLAEEIEKIGIYRSEKLGVAFPHTSITLSGLTKRIFKERTGQIPELTPSPKGKSQEFIFTSAVMEEDGNEFDFVEVAIHEIIKRLPQALADIKEGREPEDFEVITLGYPSNPLGEVSPEFVDGMKKEPFLKMAELYAEFLATKLPQQTQDARVRFYGISMGASIAALTGERLMAKQLVTQEEGKPDLPKLSIRAEVPVALGPSWFKKLQIPVGFITSGIIENFANPYVKKIGPQRLTFLNDVNALLKRRGIKTVVTEEQRKMKGQARKSIILGLGDDLILKPETKLNEVYGTRDLTMVTPRILSDRRRHEEENPDTLGKSFLSRTKDRPNSRRFSADMRHMQPFTRPNEMERLKAAAEAVSNLTT